MELTLVPSVPNNVTNFQLFEDDKHILYFITSLDVFASQIIDETEPQEVEMDLEGVINLKTNTILRGMVQLERIFYLDKVRDQEKMLRRNPLVDNVKRTTWRLKMISRMYSLEKYVL